MSDAQKIGQLEQQLANLDSNPDANIHQKIDTLNDLAWLLSDTGLKRAYALGEKACALTASLDPPNQAGMAYGLRTQGYLN
jgi:hypothetical protein